MIIAKLQKSPWHVKCRYPLLCTVIPYCDTADLLASYPALPSHLLECLETNFLAAVASDVYKACMECLQSRETNGKQVKRRKSSEDLVRPDNEWEVYWLNTVLKGLCSKKE